MKQVALNDESHFTLVSGLWKGERAPLKSAKVLRGTNFGGDGLLDFDDVVDLEVEERHFAERKLAEGDIIVERSGGGPKQPVGRVALFTPPDESPYFSSNFTTTLRVRDRTVFDPGYVALYLHALYLGGATETLQRATTGIRNLDWREYLRFEIPALPLDAQKDLAHLIGSVRKAYRNERELIDVLARLKQATMRELFTRGLCGEAQKETEIGLVPESWKPTQVVRLGVVKGGKRMPKGIPLVPENTGRPYLRVTDFRDHSIRDKGILYVPRGYEGVIQRYRISSRDVYISIAGSIGLVGQVPEHLDDANLTENAAKIVLARDDVLPRFVMYALASNACQDQIERATAKNAQPKLALTRIEQILVPLPSTLDEQHEIVTILDALDRKIALHRQKRAVLEELFQSLLHKLMTGEIRVADLDLSALGSTPSLVNPGTAEPKGDFLSRAGGASP